MEGEERDFIKADGDDNGVEGRATGGPRIFGPSIKPMDPSSLASRWPRREAAWREAMVARRRERNEAALSMVGRRRMVIVLF
mmetsp:Transcript_28794/g.59093  ORF Transcript_28794/g.59093 Transcript_28794/m.59093 type:complete len:82 (+) Transcript_28794:1459-1704(+)